MGLALLALAGACGPPADDGARLARLRLEPVLGSPPLPRPVVVERLDMEVDRERWQVSASEVALLPYRGGKRCLRLTARRGEPGPALALPGRHERGRFNEVSLLMATGGTGRVAALLESGGRVVAAGPPVELPTGGALTEVRLELPDLDPAEPPCDALRLVFDDAVGLLWLRSIDLVLRPVEARLPDVEGPARMVAIAGEARPAWGLVAGRPVQARVQVPEDGRLSFAVGVPTLLGRGAPPELLLRVEDETGPSVSEQVSLPPVGERWEVHEVSLAPLAGRLAKVRFELRAQGSGPQACALAWPAVWSPAAAPPTVLLVTSDTHRADHLGCAPGAVEIATPALDGLARRGVLFSDCMVSINVTNASHAALMTGEHPRDLRILSNTTPLAEQAATLAGRFAAAGWATAAVVSVRHLGHPTSGLGSGFDRMSWPEDVNERPADEAVARAQASLAQSEGRPLFLWLHLFDAHTPYDPPYPWSEWYYPEGVDPWDPSLPDPGLPEGVLGWELTGLRDLAWPAAAYKSEVSFLDSQLHVLLREERLARAVVAVTADHGESLGEHGIYYSHAGLFPDTLRVPLVLSWPGGPEGRRVDDPVDQRHLGATLLELAGLPTETLPGRSLVPLATDSTRDLDGPPGWAAGTTGGAGDGEDLRADPARGPAAETPRFALASNGLAASITWNGWHLILQLREQHHARMSTRFEAHQVQLYDLRADPGATIDLLDARPGLAAGLRRQLVAWLEQARDLGWSGVEQRDPELLGRLEALGYVQGGAQAAPRLLWQPDACSWCRRFDP